VIGRLFEEKDPVQIHRFARHREETGEQKHPVFIFPTSLS
jgi:hypothetical protein